MPERTPTTSKIKAYYQLTKPGIIRGNIIVAAGAFLYAAQGHVDIWKLLATLTGTSLIIASACVFNNYIDRDIDRTMKRTKNRALVTGVISPTAALVYASLLGLIGVFILVAYVNVLTAAVAAFGHFAYVILYTYSKRLTTQGTVIGSISGAVPPVAGYVAVTNNLDSAALILFIVLVVWQMPHFYAIAIFRQTDYAAAKIPVLPIKKGLPATKVQMVCYIVAFLVATLSLGVFSYAGYSYLAVMTAVSLLWLQKALKAFSTSDDIKWARGVFGFSLIALLVFSLMLSLNSLLP